MTIDEKIRDEKLEQNVHREAAEVPALLLGKSINVNTLQR